MGAGSTEIDGESTDVLLEAAVWDPAAVSRTVRRLRLVSEAGRRYERSVDPAISVAALDRCASLLADIAGGTVEPRLTDWRGDPPRRDWSPAAVRMRFDLPDRMAGVEYEPGAAVNRLTQIGAGSTRTASIRRSSSSPRPAGGPTSCSPPTSSRRCCGWRASTRFRRCCPPRPRVRGLTAAQKRRRAVGKSLALGGYVEVLPTPFLPAGVFDQWGLPADDPRRITTAVLNPLEADRPHLATTLLPALLEALSRNVSRGFVDVALFAIAQVVQPTERTGAVQLIPTHRRPTDEEIAALDAPCRISRCTSARSSPGCGNRADPGVPGAPSRPPTHSRRCG